jgi:hypothetical protein
MSGEQGSENAAPTNGDAGAAGPVRPRAIAPGGLLQADDIMPWHLARTLAGEKCAVITVIGVQGAAPRITKGIHDLATQSFTHDRRSTR